MEENTARLTRKQKRILRQNGARSNNQEKINFTLKNFEPLTQNQKISFDAYNQGKNLMLHGIAGTGKSFISLYLGLKQILSENSQYKKVIIVRSVVPTRDMGFLPGILKKRQRYMKLHITPYAQNCSVEEMLMNILNRKILSISSVLLSYVALLSMIVLLSLTR
jgi:predicted ribonuclease YlaK